jgi:MoaA/NifB/PqqE/SkfB family radical SAM enzyme
MSPDGTIYACNILDLPLGNLAGASFEDIWNSPGAVKVRAAVSTCEMGCWMVCTARSAMKREQLKVAGWITRSKLKAMLGKPVLK